MRLAGLEPIPELEKALLEARTVVAERRVKASEARAALQTLLREADLRSKRLETVVADIEQWAGRIARSTAASADLNARLERARAEHQTLQNAPDTFLLRRRAILNEIETADLKRKEAAERLAEAETALTEADKIARETLDGLAGARERRAGSLARAEAAERRQAELVRAIADTFDTTPMKIFELTGIPSLSSAISSLLWRAVSLSP